MSEAAVTLAYGCYNTIPEETHQLFMASHGYGFITKLLKPNQRLDKGNWRLKRRKAENILNGSLVKKVERPD